jgi:minor extracellular serine protease Vpr
VNLRYLDIVPDIDNRPPVDFYISLPKRGIFWNGENTMKKQTLSTPGLRSSATPLSTAVKRGNLGICATMAAGMLFALGSTIASAQGISTMAPDVSKFALPEAQTVVDASLRASQGPVNVVIQLTRPSLASAMGPNAKRSGGKLDRSQQRAWLKATKSQQDAVGAKLAAVGGKELGRVSKVLNAVVATVDAKDIATLAATPGVASIRPLRNYELHLSETVDYIGARSGLLAPGGADGSGITVAVLDSGIDYTHANLGGPGTPEAYVAAYGAGVGDPAQTTRDGLFPTAKVIDGYDFVGEQWPFAPEAPDEDPIDYEGHGTHVADIIAGNGGVAPGANLVAVKVCSAVSSSCSGLALLQGMDFALDPNGDGDISDAVDVINMSLGSSFGQQEDDLSFASANAVNYGVTVVASAGNSADRPYIVGSPSSTPGVISVAQTQVPGAVAIGLNTLEPAAIAGTDNNTATLDFAPITDGFEGPVQYVGLACDPIAPVAPGTVVLAMRGTCAISVKVDNAADAGAAGFVMMMAAPGDAQTFSFGGPDTYDAVQSLVVTQARGLAIRNQLTAGNTVVVSVDPAVGVSLAGSMVASSSRGPSMSFDAIKPDIGAPGASVSAIAGSATGTGAFGGTSGAAPMVSGAAALLLSLDPSMSPQTVKGRLMGSGETEVYTNPALQPGVLAPVTRIGGGEVRVDSAAAASTIAFDTASGQPSLSFGYHKLTGPKTLQRNLTIRNLGSETRTYSVSPQFRFADDQASGAVSASIAGGNSVTVPAGGESTIRVRLSIDPSKLPGWLLDSGATQGNGALLTGPEYDGYLVLSSNDEDVRVPWQVLPRAAANVAAAQPVVNLKSANPGVTVSNSGAVDGYWSAYALTGTSGRIPPGLQPGSGENHRPEGRGCQGVAAVRPGPVRGEHLGRAFASVLSGGLRSAGRHGSGWQPRLVHLQRGTWQLCLQRTDCGLRRQRQWRGRRVLLPRRRSELLEPHPLRAHVRDGSDGRFAVRFHGAGV